METRLFINNTAATRTDRQIMPGTPTTQDIDLAHDPSSP
jgi:hypothetical protein